jgi:hypothetical protein
MTRIEHRLADALAARARAVDPKSVRPLPWGAPAREPRHRSESRRRWLAPAAAAISIVVIAAVVTFLPRHDHRAGHGQDHPITAQRVALHGKLWGVDALSATNAWAVGTIFQDPKGAPTSNFRPLIMHWDGRSWRRVPVPSIANESSLLAVSGTSPDDVWAVGSWTQSLHHTGEALILHWNGKKWRLARSAGSFKVSQLIAVSARSATDTWAVGDSGNNGALLLHWNGRIWRQAPAPLPNPSQYLQGVADISGGDAWAVGGDKRREFILHWNGTSWRIAPNPRAGRGASGLLDMSVLLASEIWAIGYGLGPGNIKFLRWNGSAWHAEPGPNIPVAPPVFWAVAAISPGSIWGAGSTNTLGVHGNVLIMHWDGTSWSVPKGVNRHVHGAIYRLSARSASDIWAVGRQSQNPLILHWNGKLWTKVLS